MRKIVAANWKMNKTATEAHVLMSQILEEADEVRDRSVEMILCCPFLYLKEFAKKAREAPNLKMGAQNCFWEEDGAFTGEISPVMLRSIDVDYVILGHSERRAIFNESDDQINKKLQASLKAGLKPILCVGESLDQRQAGIHLSIVKDQLFKALDGVDPDKGEFLIAYEPVWAIGTGETASPEQAQEMHQHIRTQIAQINEHWKEVPILYGGSVNDSNATSLFSQPDVNGGLVGGASLRASSFLRIAQSFRS